MTRIFLYSLSILIICICLYVDLKPAFEISPSDDRSYTSYTKTEFLDKIPQDAHIVLGYALPLGTVKKKVYRMNRQALSDSMLVSTHDDPLYDGIDISYAWQSARGEIRLPDKSIMSTADFINLMNRADSFFSLVDQGVSYRSEEMEKQIYRTVLEGTIKFYLKAIGFVGLLICLFYFFRIALLTYFKKDFSIYILLALLPLYIYSCYAESNQNILSFTAFNPNDSIALINQFETILYQQYIFLCLFLLLIVIYQYYIRSTATLIKHKYSLTFLYFFSASLGLFVITQLIIKQYFILKYDVPNTMNERATASAFPLALFITFGVMAMDYFRRPSVDRIKIAEDRVLQSESTLSALQSSVNPHFLYNSLNSIAALSETDAAKTKQMTLALSDFYKYTTNRQNQSFSTVRDELEMIQNYLEIEKIRFGDRLNYSIIAEEEVYSLTIPYFLLQPLVENAVKYGYDAGRDVIEVRVELLLHEDQIHIKIKDTGAAFQDTMDQGYGLRMVTQKLKLLYPDQHELSLMNVPKQVLIKIKNKHIV